MSQASRRDLLLAVAALTVAGCDAAPDGELPERRDEPNPSPGGQALREISAVLDVTPADVEARRPEPITIYGDGHAHAVALQTRDWQWVAANGEAIVRSGPGGDDGHRHWVVVRVTS